MGKIITDWHIDRLENLIKTSGGKLIHGGRVDKSAKYCEPTLIDGPTYNSPVMEEEIFGPILPIVTFKTIDEAINYVNSKDKPLAIYYFGRCFMNGNKDRVMKETSSGAFVVNDALT